MIFLKPCLQVYKGFPGGAEVTNQPANAGAAGEAGLIPRTERSPGGGNGNPLQCWPLPYLVLYAQPCPTLCGPMDCSLQGSSVHGISQATILKWIACPPPGDLPDPGIEPMSLMSPALAGGFFTTSTTWEASPYRYINSTFINYLQIAQNECAISFMPGPWQICRREYRFVI